MPSDLKLNPYAVLSAKNEQPGEWVLIAPKVSEGLQILDISETDDPALCATFAGLSQAGLSLLDIENDLDDRQRDLLTRFGVLVTAENTPEKPLFSCLLDYVDAGETASDKRSLCVNPTFRFEPFDLSNFRALAAEKHFSPFLPAVWIKSPGAEVDLGYWLSHEQAAILSGFHAGEQIPANVDPGLSAKLEAAGIIIDPQLYSEDEKNAAVRILEAKELFSQHKYATLENVIPEWHIRAMQVFYRAYIAQGFMWFGDTRVSRRFREGNEPLARFFHLSMTSLMSKLVGREVKPSYCYAASYRGGADLPPHVDREACEYSFSIQIDYEPEPPDSFSPWPLCLSTRKLPKFNEENKNSLDWSDFVPGQETEKAIYLRSGDCLAYRGRELAHYRSALPEGHRSTSLFFHYVPLDFDGALI